MRDLAVAAIRDGRGREKRGGFLLGDARQKPVEPGVKVFRRQKAPHALRLNQRGGQKVVARRFPALTIDIRIVPRLRLAAKQSGEFRVISRRSEVGDKRESERAVEMRSRAHGIGRLRQKLVEARNEYLDDRL